jgi:chromosome segregation ATPase
MNFFSWLNTEVGLKPWHLQTIAITVVILLLLILRHLRKSRIEKMHKIQSKGRSEIIGLKLSDRRVSHRRVSDLKKQSEGFISEEETKHKPWGQTTKEWRQLREQIRKLEHDTAKGKRTEEKLKKRITELENSNEQLKSEIIERKQTEKDLIQQVKEITNANEEAEERQDTEIKQSTEEQTAAGETNKESKQDLTKQPVQITDLSEQFENTGTKSVQTEEDIKSKEEKNTSIHMDAEKQNSETAREDTEQTEESIENHNVPLDIKELKAIADLAKRLQGRG